MPNPEFEHFKDGNVIYDVYDGVARQHIPSSITTVTGMHGIRYYDDTLSYFDSTQNEWVEIETSGGVVELTAEEFAQLSDDEKNENVLYIITDGLDGSGSGDLTGVFTGTHAQWEALSDSDKEVYSLVFFNDDYESVSGAFTGATTTSNGVAGAVPVPLIADRDKFLKGDGSWSEIGPTTPNFKIENNALYVFMQ